MKLKVISQTENTKKDIDISFADNKISSDMHISDYLNSLISNRAKTTAHTKTRAEKSGGGAKPWRQKGTGRARHGSSRSPIWSGGGITFGPRNNKNNSKFTNKKSKDSAVKSIFSKYIANNKLVIVDKIPVYKNTKKAVEWIAKLPVENGSICLITSNSSQDMLAYRNISFIQIVYSNSINMLTVVNNDMVVIDVETIKKIDNNNEKISKNNK